jgi:hypothetical protein
VLRARGLQVQEPVTSGKIFKKVGKDLLTHILMDL